MLVDIIFIAIILYLLLPKILPRLINYFQKRESSSIVRIASSISDQYIGPQLDITDYSRKAKILNYGQFNVMLPKQRGPSKFNSVTAYFGDKTIDITPPIQMKLYFTKPCEIGATKIVIVNRDDEVTEYFDDQTIDV